MRPPLAYLFDITQQTSTTMASNSISMQDYSRTPFTASMAIDKKTSTQLLSLAREGILREGKYSKSSFPQNPFRTAQRILTDTST